MGQRDAEEEEEEDEEDEQEGSREDVEASVKKEPS